VTTNVKDQDYLLRDIPLDTAQLSPGYHYEGSRKQVSGIFTFIFGGDN
jgi:hypothetical protein